MGCLFLTGGMYALVFSTVCVCMYMCSLFLFLSIYIYMLYLHAYIYIHTYTHIRMFQGNCPPGVFRMYFPMCASEASVCSNHESLALLPSDHMKLV